MRLISGFTLIELLIVISIIVILVAMQPTRMPVPASRIKSSRAKADMRQLGQAIEAFREKHKHYPPMRPLKELARNPKDVERLRAARLSACDLGDSPALRFVDPFTEHAGALPYGYYTDGKKWIVISAGPDAKFDIDPVRDCSGDQPLPNSRMIHLTYDPTNGSFSSGDIYRVGESAPLAAPPIVNPPPQHE